MIVNKTGIDLGTTYKNYGNRKPSNNRQAGTGGNNSKMLSNQAFQGRGLAYQGFYIPFTGGINDKKLMHTRCLSLKILCTMQIPLQKI